MDEYEDDVEVDLSKFKSEQFEPETRTVKVEMFSKAPGMWRKPRVKVYDYNQDFGGNYYQPMIHYINQKENQGNYFSKPKDIYLPVSAEVGSDKFNNARKCEQSGDDLDHYLVKAYANQIKERNKETANVHYHQLHGSKANTDFDKFHLLSQHQPAVATRNLWCRELMMVNNENTRKELESEAYSEAMSRMMRRKLALEEQNAWRKDPVKVKAARESAKAAVYMYSSVPLSKEERKAKLAGEMYIDKPVDLDRMYYYWSRWIIEWKLQLEKQTSENLDYLENEHSLKTEKQKQLRGDFY